MLWTCSSCGFYNDQAGDCCNCGRAQTFQLETNEVPDLLASTYNTQITLDTLEDHQKTTASEKASAENKKQSALDLAMAFDGGHDGSSILEEQERADDLREQVAVQQQQQQQQFQFERTQPRPSTTTAPQPHSTPQTNNNSHSHQYQHAYEPNPDDTLQSELSYANDATISITTDHYSQSSTLRFAILNYHFLRVFFFYLTANFALAFASIVMTAIVVISVLAMGLEFDKDSFLDKFADFAAYTLVVGYALYVAIFLPQLTYLYQRSASLWAPETPFVSPTAFVDYLSSHAPALTTPQIDAISNHFILSQVGKDVVVFVQILPQFKTRSAVVGIHYIPTPHDNDYTFDGSDNLSALTNSSSATTHHSEQMSSSQLARTTSSLTGQPFFIPKWSQNPSGLKFLKVAQMVSFFLLCEPVMMPLLLSCCTGARKYGVSIFKK